MAHQRVLIIEDDQDFGRQLKHLFEFQGYHVQLVGTGAEGVAAFDGGGFDIVIADLVLPGMGGVETVRIIRGLPGGESTPMIFMSAVYRDPRRFEGELRELGILEFLPKPFSLIDLGRKVDAILDHSLGLDADDAKVTNTGSWRVEELQAALGDDSTGLTEVSQFTRRTLLNIFIEIFRTHAAGTLILSNRHSKRVVRFLNGYPVSAESDDPADSLQQLLVMKGRATQEQVAAAEERAAREGISLETSLLRSDLVSERVLNRMGRLRVRRVVVGCFRWAEGGCSFQPGADSVRQGSVHEVNPVRCLGEAVSRFLALNDLAPDIYPRTSHRLEKGPRFKRLVPYLTLPKEVDGLLECMEGDQTVRDIFVRFSGAQEPLIKTLWLMFSLGIAESSGAPDAAEISGDFKPVDDVESVTEPVPVEALSDGAMIEEIATLHDDLMDADYYRVLGVERSVEDAALRAAHDAKKALLTPGEELAEDRGSIRRARELLERLDVAYRTLSDPDGRRAYDDRLVLLESGQWAAPPLEKA